MTTSVDRAEVRPSGNSGRDFEVVVIGAGPGGYVAAIRSAQLGKRVAVIEERYWGGVCLNVGCIPSKALLRNAELAHLVQRRAEEFGISGEITVDYAVGHRRSRDVADGRTKGVHYLMRKNGITEIDGRATFLDRHTLEVRSGDNARRVSFDHAIVATGAHVALPPGIELSASVMTYEEVVLDDTVPSSMLVIGGGAIGVELGYIMACNGCDVTVVETVDRILPAEDIDVSHEVTKAFTKLGIRVLPSTRVETVGDDGEWVTVTWTPAGVEGGEEHVFDRVLVATGFRPNSAKLGLEAAGVATDARGAVLVDERMRTSSEHIYAIGDLTMQMQLAHVAEAMAVVAAETIAGAVTMELGDLRMMPRATFCSLRSPASGSPRSKPATNTASSGWPSSHSPRTARPTVRATPPGS